MAPVEVAVDMVGPVIEHLHVDGLAGTMRPAAMVETVVAILRRAGDERSRDVARLAGQYVTERASLIDDDELRAVFLAAEPQRRLIALDQLMEVGSVTGTVGDHYRRSRHRLREILVGLDDADWERAVPACPGWRVHDVVAHLVGVIEDGMAGRLDGPPDDSVTAEEVRRHRDVAHGDLLHHWDELAPLMEVAITDNEVWPAAFDVLSHEHDVRGGARPARRAGCRHRGDRRRSPSRSTGPARWCCACSSRVVS